MSIEAEFLYALSWVSGATCQMIENKDLEIKKLSHRVLDLEQLIRELNVGNINLETAMEVVTGKREV